MINRFEEQLSTVFQAIRSEASIAMDGYIDSPDAIAAIDELAAGALRDLDRRAELSPLVAAVRITPWWMHRIQEFDALEIHPCCAVGTMPNGKVAVETCERTDAQFWTVYGHYVPGGPCGGVEAFEDFATETGAIQFRDRLQNAYPHLAR